VYLFDIFIAINSPLAQRTLPFIGWVHTPLSAGGFLYWGNLLSISKKTRFEVFKRDSFTCQYCGQSAPDVILEVDHIHPRAEDGSDDISNLITSCFDCNRGKGARRLSDDTVAKKRKKQLDDLQARREQIEMMAQWHLSLADLGQQEVDAYSELWDKLTGGVYDLSDHGRKKAGQIIKRFGLSLALQSLTTAVRQYIKYDDDGEIVQDSANHALNKVGGICQVTKNGGYNEKWGEACYVARILSNRLTYTPNEIDLRKSILVLLEQGFKFEWLKSLAAEVRNWTEWREEIEDGLRMAEDAATEATDA